ncbi:MAG: hypothetical protein IIZ59_04335 [Clostridia bacterium]|nr:hypothetical protein [Clostridia bacterium]
MSIKEINSDEKSDSVKTDGIRALNEKNSGITAENTSVKKDAQSIRKFSLERFFENDKVKLTLSFLAAFLLWVVMSVNSGETTNYPVTDIPVTLELSDAALDDDLAIMTIDGVPVDDFTVTVRVKGNSVTVGSLSAGDIQVYGTNLGNVVTSGTYNIGLLAKPLGVKNNYDIVSVVPSDVKIVVDRNLTGELAIESNINVVSPAEYFIGAASLSEQTVTVTGPEQSVTKAVKAAVYADIEGAIEETTTFSGLEVVLLDSAGNKIEDDSLTLTPATVDATIPVLVKKKVPITLDLIGAPDYFDGSSLISIEPSEIEIAATASTLDSVKNISAGTLDFSSVSYGMAAASYTIVMPEGVRNLSGIETATVSFNFTDYKTKAIIISNIDFINVPSGLAAEYSSYSNLIARVIGPKEEIAEITRDDITATVDLSSAKVGSSVMPVSVTINKAETGCWLFYDDGAYKVNVTVKDAHNVISSSPSSSTESR